ncbi:MAG: hypothetical protein JW847_00500 [Candidatus Omnitrophica bacterium]|nr:hypothetical protein [Candidatus Omnitrophota bacterium]
MKNLSSGGFTVIETIIAILVFAIALLGGIAVYFNAARISTMAVHKKIATEVVNARMEELRGMDYAAFSSTYPPGFYDDTPASPTLTLKGIPATRSITVTYDTSKCPVSVHSLVKVSVTWTEANQASARPPVSLETCFAP